VVGPVRQERRRRTRLRSVRSGVQGMLFGDNPEAARYVSGAEVQDMLQTASTEG